jgi:DNA repair protein RecO (recombination protein O)
MLRPRTYQTEAIIIKKTKLGEADRILTLYSIDLGKIQGVAKGIRRPRSKLAGHLELLTHSLVTFARGRNLDTIIGSQTIDSFLPLKNDLDLTAYALYAAELVNQFTAEHIENHVVFQLLIETMHRLSRTADHQLLLRYFELRLLETSGYRPQLQECVVCRQPLKPVANLFSSSAGGIICPGCRRNQEMVFPISVDALKTLRWLQGNDIDTALRLKIVPPLSRELEMTTRNYIKYLLEREVKSVAWLDSLKGQLP